MTSTSVIGLQWGDEAKGKFVDLLTKQHDIVVRYQGGNNAGHTVQFGGNTYKLSLLPAGILHEGITSVLGPGVVINPEAFLLELDQIISKNGTLKNELCISDRAHVIFPWHFKEEEVLESSRKEDKIGTTMRGIGTCYREKYGRTHAIRMGELCRPQLFRSRLNDVIPYKNQLLSAMDASFTPFEIESVFEEYSQYANRLRPYVCNTSELLHKALKEKQSLLFEGAQGCLLDIDHGTFPYVTSSNSSGAALHSGSGVSERVIDNMLGVAKAYTTRVGTGPLPTELKDEIGQHIRDRGNEYGTVTGRPRRCGWFDAVATRYAVQISGVDQIVIALLDVLDELDELKICEAYEIDGVRTNVFPSIEEDLAKAIPIYKTLPGWQTDISDTRSYDQLPSEAKDYVRTISQLLGVPLAYLSVGPDREQTIVVSNCSL